MENSNPKHKFTARQKQILSLVRKGLTNVEICRILNISANTVKVHLANIYKILDVSNRTEAVSFGLLNMDDDAKCSSEIKIFVVRKNIIDNPQMNFFFFLFAQHLHRYNLFNVQFVTEEIRENDVDYQIVLSETQNPEPCFYLSLFNGNMSRIFWVYSQKVDEKLDMNFASSKVIVQLYRRMLISAARSFERGENQQPSWWFCCAFVNYKLDCRSRESFEKCERELMILLLDDSGNIFLKFSLVRLYYTAITEGWVKTQSYFDKIQELASSAMRDDPYSDYSRLMMAIFNILDGNMKAAITYLLLVTEANPQNFFANMLLSHIYLLMGEETKALVLFNEYERYFPDLENDPNQIIAKILVLFLLRDYEKCEECAMRASYIRSKSVYPLLFIILCRMLKDDWTSVEIHKQMLFQYHPNFKISDSVQLLKGIKPSQRQVIVALLEKAFGKINPQK